MPGILCEHCTAACCRYVALPIETPTTRAEFDDVRWYLLHEGISVFVEDGEWYISFTSSCRHLQPDYRCGIYETRPKICRKYSTENCDYHSGDYGWEQHFTCPEHLDEYVRNVWSPQQAEKKGRKAGGRSRPRLKAKLPSRRPQPTDYAAATADIAGIPLPILGVRR